MSPDRIVVPSRDDAVARSASRVIGGPLGRYAVPLARGWRHVAALLVAASMVPMALSVAVRGYCVEGGWRSPDQFFHMCFSDLPATFGNSNLGAGVGAFLAGGADAPTPEQPPLLALLSTITGGLIPDGSPETRARLFFGVWALLLTVALALTVWWTARSVSRMPLRASHIALSPIVALTALVAPDLVGVALTAAALWAWSSDRMRWAGVWLGLAISTVHYPVVVLIAFCLVAVRAGRWGEVRALVGVTLLTLAAVFALVAWRNPTGALQSYVGWMQASAGFGSLWVGPQLAGSPLPTVAVTALAVAGWVVALMAGAFFALGAPRRPGVAEVSLVMLVIVVVTAKAFPVQASLWLVPLVALVGLRWRDHLWWAGAEALHFGAVWLYLAGVSVPDRGLPSGWYLVALAARLVAVIWLAVTVWRTAWRRVPADIEDLTPEETDPLAGPLERVPDALLVKVV